MGERVGYGSERCVKRAVAAVEIERGRTEALRRGRESGIVETSISAQVV